MTDSIVAEVDVATLAKAFKSALAFTEPPEFAQSYDYIRLFATDGYLYIAAGSRYAVGINRLHSSTLTKGSDLEIRAESIKAAVDWLKPGRTKPRVSVVWEHSLLLRRHDKESEPFTLETHTAPSPMPPVFDYPYEPIEWTEPADSLKPMAARFAIAPEYLSLIIKASWAKTDAVILEGGQVPSDPITVRIGDYLIAVIAPKYGKNTTTEAPNIWATRESWWTAAQYSGLARQRVR